MRWSTSVACARRLACVPSPGIVDQERVDQRQVAQRGVGAARRRHAKRLARQPFQVAVLAEVHDGVGAELGVEPVVRGQIVMAGRQIGVVIDGDRVLTETAWRLHDQHDVAGLHCGDDDLAVGVAAAVDEQLTGRRAPMLDDGVGELAGQRGEPVAIVLGGHPDRIARELSVGEPVRILAAALDQRVHQRVAVLGVDAGDVADAVAGVAHRPQQRDRAGRGVEPDRVADAGVLGRVRREHQRPPACRSAAIVRSRACRTASPATRAQRSGSAT